MQKRYPLIDNLYTFGMLLVVLGHIGLNPDFSSSYLFRWIYAFHMPLFFWISGFLFGDSKRGGFIQFVVKKSKRLLLPLIVLTTLVYYPKVLLSDFAVRQADGGFVGYIKSLFYPDQNPIQLLWFLTVLFDTYIIGWLVNAINRANTICWIGVGALSVVLYYILPDIKFLGISKVLYYFPYFSVGVLCRRYYNRVLPELYKFNLPIFSVSGVLLSVCVMFEINEYILAFLGIIFSIAFIGYLTNHNVSFFSELRPYTFTIYLLQWFPMVVVRVVCYNMLCWDVYLCYILMFIAGLFVPVFIGAVCLRIFPDKGFGKFVRQSVGL